MAFTPNGLYYPTGDVAVSPLHTVLAQMQESVDTALDSIESDVLSVNGKTGVVSLNANDVGARSSSWVPSWSQVTGKPSTFLPRTTLHSLNAPVETTAQSASFTAAYLEIPALSYIRLMTVSLSLSATVAASGDWRIRLGTEASLSTGDPATSLTEIEMVNPTTSNVRMSAAGSGLFRLPASTSIVVRVQAARAGGGALTPLDLYGFTLQVAGIEIAAY